MTKLELEFWFINEETDLMLKMTEVHHGFHNIEPNPYHLEGSIWTHTQMVMNVCEREYKNHTMYQELLLISLLHDIGKTITAEDIFGDSNSTSELGKKNRRSFKNHESASYFMAIDILEKFPEPVFKDLILKTIANHGSLYNYFNGSVIDLKYKDKITKMYSKDVKSLILLRDFYVCDHLGRIQENNKFNITETLRSFDEIIYNVSFNDTIINDKTLTVLIGLPRSGKSTYCKNSNKTIISRDFYVEQIGIGNNYSEKFKSLTEDQHKIIDSMILRDFNIAVKTGKDIIIDMTNMSKKSRKKWLNVKEYMKEAVIFQTSKETCLKRNTIDKFIPNIVFDRMMLSFTYPDFDEFDNISINRSI